MRVRGFIAIGAIVAGVVVLNGTAAAAAPDGPELVSRDADGEPFPADPVEPLGAQVSDDGNRVVFHIVCQADTPSQVYVRDRAAGTTSLEFETSGHWCVNEFALSGNGRYLAISQRTNDLDTTVSVHDLDTGSTYHIGDGTEINGISLSDDGRTIAYSKVDSETYRGVVFVEDLNTGTVTRVSSTAAQASDAVLSGDGTTVAYRQYRHVYSRVVASGKLTRIDVRPDGTFGPGGNARPVAFSDTGRFLLFGSAQTDLATGTGACDDGPDADCVFRRNIAESKTTVASVLPGGAVSGTQNGYADLSGDGRVVAFQEPPGPAGHSQVHVRVLATASTRLASVNADGQPADSYTFDPSLSQDGALVTFHTAATNFGHPQLAGSQVWIARGK